MARFSNNFCLALKLSDALNTFSRFLDRVRWRFPALLSVDELEFVTLNVKRGLHRNRRAARMVRMREKSPTESFPFPPQWPWNVPVRLPSRRINTEYKTKKKGYIMSRISQTEIAVRMLSRDAQYGGHIVPSNPTSTKFDATISMFSSLCRTIFIYLKSLTLGSMLFWLMN